VVRRRGDAPARERRAVDLDKGPLTGVRSRKYRTRDQLFPGASLSQNQNPRISERNQMYLVEH
jgi:hypothetical protein